MNPYRAFLAECAGCVLIATAIGCGGSDDGETVIDSGVQPDTNDVNDTAEEPSGPWECIENNVARNTDDGTTQKCYVQKCKPGKGCNITAAGCASDDDCISSTLEMGESQDIKVHCEELTHVCGYVVQ